MHMFSDQEIQTDSVIICMTDRQQFNYPSRKYCGLTLNEIFKICGTVLVPLLLAIFTVFITIEQRGENQVQREQDLNISALQREQDRNISAMQRAHDKEIAQNKRDADDLNAAIQRNISITERHHELNVETVRYLDTLLMSYINDIGLQLKESNGLLTSHPIVAALARAKTLSVIRQLDAKRNSHLIQFLYDAGQLIRNTSLSLHGAQLNGIDLSSSVRSTSMDFVNLTGAYLNNASFAGQKILNATFTGAHLQGANFTRCKFRFAVFDETILINATFSQAILMSVSFEDADLTGASFNRIYGLFLKFIRAQLIGASFVDARLYFLRKPCQFLNSYLDDAIFHRAVLDHTSFIHCDLIRTDMTDIYLYQASFLTSRLIKTKFVNALMKNITLTWSSLAYANLTGAKNFDHSALNEVMSITNTTLPNGTLGLIRSLVQNGDADCDMILQGSWQVEYGNIEIKTDPANTDNCIFTISSTSTSRAMMSQLVELDKFIPLVMIERAVLYYRLHGAEALFHIDQFGKDGKQLTGINSIYAGAEHWLIVNENAVKLNISIEFLSNSISWCDNIEIEIEPRTRLREVDRWPENIREQFLSEANIFSW